MADRAEEALRAILKWCDAYPIEIFHAPDLKGIRTKISDNEMSRLHAHWARHLLGGIAETARRGLGEDGNG